MSPGRGVRTPRTRRDGIGDYLKTLSSERLRELAEEVVVPIPDCPDCGRPVVDEIIWGGGQYPETCAFCRQSPIAFDEDPRDPAWILPYRERARGLPL